jgi:hypothetical protein
MAGFSDGFAQGFGLVDAALQRRQANENYEQRMATEDARYQDEMARQQMLDQRNEDHYNNGLAAQQQAAKFEQEKYRHQLVKDDREFGLKEADQFSNNAYRQTQLENQGKQLDINAMQARSSIAESQAQTERYRLETQYAKQQKAREDAQRYVQANIFTTDPNTGETSIRWNKGNELNDLAMIQQATGINVGKIAGDFNRFNQDLKHIKSALALPGYFQQNKAAVIKAFNDIEFDDINKGLGPYDGDNPEFKGGEVVRKEVTDVYPSPDNKGFVFNVRTIVRKNGKDYVDEGPITQYRSSSPADDRIRVIGTDQIVRRVDGLDVLGIALATNPEWAREAANAYRQQTPMAKGDYQPVIEENYNTETMANEKRYVGAFNKDTGEITRTGQATQPAKSSPDEQRRKAEYVLNNRSKFKDRPDIIQAAERAMKGNQGALQPGLQDVERYSLSPALANVGVTAPQGQPRAESNEAVTRQQLINEINGLTGNRFEIPADATVDQLRQWLNENKAQQHPSPKPPMDNSSWVVRGAKTAGQEVLELGAKKREQWSKALDAL